MAKRRESVKSGHNRIGRAVKPEPVGPFAIIADRLLFLVGMASAAAFAYLMYGLASGHITLFPAAPNGQTLTPEMQVALRAWIIRATYILAWGSLASVLIAVVRYRRSSSPVLAAAAIGGFLYLGLPALTAAMLQQGYRAPNVLTDTIIIGTRVAGKVTLLLSLGLGTAHVFWAATRRLRRGRVRRTGPGQAAARSRSLIPRCWDLSMCRSPSGACPRARQRKTCWKSGSGCMCDLALAERLATGAEAWAHEDAVAIRYRAGSGAKPCNSCPLYEEYQGHKFHFLQWLAYPATVGIMVATRVPLHTGYDRVLAFMDRVMAGLSFMPYVTEATQNSGMQSAVLSSNVEWVFIACVWLLLVSYVLQGVELFTFRWGW